MTLEPVTVFVIDPDIYINDMFDTFIAPALNTPPCTTSTMRVHYYRHLVRDLTRKTLSDRFPAMAAEHIFSVFIEVTKTLGLCPI